MPYMIRCVIKTEPADKFKGVLRWIYQFNASASVTAPKHFLLSVYCITFPAEALIQGKWREILSPERHITEQAAPATNPDDRSFLERR
jgi:hypothetical protein